MFTLDDIVTAARGQAVRTGTCAKIKGIGIDTRTIKKGQAFLAVKGERYDGHDFAQAAVKRGAGTLIIRRRAQRAVLKKIPSSVSVVAVEDTVAALGDIAHFHRNRFNVPIVAVTGSNGKTTTKDMIGACLGSSGKVLKTEGTRNNHIGVPLTLLNLTRAHTCAVLELGTNHMGEIDYLGRIARPTIGVITNIGPSHLEFLHDLEGVLREKYSLRSSLRAPAIMVLNADDLMLKKETKRMHAGYTVLSYGIHCPADFSLTHWEKVQAAFRFRVNGAQPIEVTAVGFHNLYNALAAVAVARILGVSYRGIARGLKGFTCPLKRLNITYAAKTRFIDDTYNSNPLSLRTALEALADMSVKGRKIVIMGDMLELGERAEFYHREAGETACRICDTLITVGSLSRFAADTARMFGLRADNVYVCDSAAHARDVLFNKICPSAHDVVLVKGSRSMAMEKILEN